MRTYIVYHGPACADGFTAAWIAHSVFAEDSTTYHPMNYGESAEWLQPTKADTVYVLDFSFDAPTMERLARSARTLVWLDHHSSAIAELGPLMISLQGAEGVDVQGRWTAEISGAMLAWECFNSETDPVDPLVEYVQDRDLWKWTLPASREVNAVVSVTPRTFQEWSRLSGLLKSRPGQVIASGLAMMKLSAQFVEIICDEAVAVVMQFEGGHVVVVPMVSCPPILASDVGAALCRRYPDAVFSLSYYDRKDGRRTWNLRTVKVGYDMGQYAAKAHGGGGHMTAAGFVTDRDWFPLPSRDPLPLRQP